MGTVVVEIGVADQALELVPDQFLGLEVPFSLEEHRQPDPIHHKPINNFIQNKIVQPSILFPINLYTSNIPLKVDTKLLWSVQRDNIQQNLK